ncbi:tetratricopeptide repeat-containing sulfotransferase family protein [Paraglaciecola aquimarina]
MNDIKGALQSGNTDKAINLCQQALKNLGDKDKEQQVDILYMLAVAQRSKGAIVEANQTLDTLLPLAPEHSRAYQEQGYLYLLTGDKVKATLAFAKASKLNPALLASWQQLSTLYAELGPASGQNHATQQVEYLTHLPTEIRGARDLMYEGKLALADKVCRRFLQNHKHHAEAMLLLAEIGMQLKLYHEAEFLLESCVEIHPAHINARAEYVKLLSKLGKFSKAKQQADLLLSKQADSQPFLAAKASAMVGIGEIEAAIAIYQDILKTRNDLPGIQLLLGHAYKAQGEIKAAIQAYRQAYKIRPSFGDAYWSLANTKTYQFTDSELTLMHNQLNNVALEVDDKIHLQFALAKTYEDRLQFEQSFHFYQSANNSKKDCIHYSQDKLEEQISAQKTVFSRDFFSAHSNLGAADPAPIFIVGLPRAGSTLLEQILASHSMVDGTMELHNILGLAARLSGSKSGYPNVMNEIDKQYFRRFGEQFIEQTQSYRQGAPYFIDKMPNNFMHIGLIKTILPNAKIIDARREPMACCFSGYKQLFAEGQEFSYDLSDLAHYYQSYQALMTHWDEVLPGFVLRVQHEDLIDDLETQTRRLLDFCQLPFEANCLEFYKTKRAVKTPSSEQVRQPINANAKEQWKHFAPYLSELASVFK